MASSVALKVKALKLGWKHCRVQRRSAESMSTHNKHSVLERIFTFVLNGDAVLKQVPDVCMKSDVCVKSTVRNQVGNNLTAV